ncbi:hypothetical protein BO78DRAFT_434227 [Aspergillus sclerotiicarbonarius CBS 121057]|uniref:Zn(2)-C6 fungal-type domain-containing protein n=1 Tax=Aspergillus sclerotiicarbonarius (strain CBS 121057 / IBT 28362) TaxID=1448318 RepID=A0A319DSP2_ASPSB|nr:hypothetical protein BO78DRAFT_434227 [Aspergillus sclerotiicarbonarius CBS 121057]
MTSTTTTPRRQSCDRCHGQKLRCTRAGNSDTEPCIRCIRQGAECIYSSSLPKGRPSMYRLADSSSENTNLPRSSVRRARSRQSSLVGASDPDPNAKLSASTANRSDTSNDATSSPDMDIDTAPVTESNMTLPGSTDLSQLFPALVDSSTEMWSCVSQPIWHNLEGQGNDQDWTSNMLNFIDPQIDGPLSCLDTVPGLLPWGNNDCSCLGSELLMTTDIGGGLMENKNCPDVGISQLSQLSSRLSSLYRWSCAVADNSESAFQSSDSTQSCPSSLINDVAFKSVASWLVHVSSDMRLFPCPDPKTSTLDQFSTNDTLHNVFTASYQFLEILRGLQPEACSGVHTSVFDSQGGICDDAWTNTLPASISMPDIQIPTSRPQENSYSSIVERHLVIACHTLLLKIYVAVFTSLQCDVDRWSSRLRPGNVDQDADANAASLADIRLVLVVQLCNYILERQYQAVSGCLGPQFPPVQSQQAELSGTSQAHKIEGVNSGPDSEVQHRLVRLRQSLRM